MFFSTGERAKKPRVKMAEKKKTDLEKILDAEFSFYVRASSRDRMGLIRCVTCGKLEELKDIDCGHYITRALRSTRWDEKNVGPQCRKCNRFLNGMAHEFRAYLVGKWGAEEIEKLEMRSRMISGETRETLLEKIKEYREKNKELRRE